MEQLQAEYDKLALFLNRTLKLFKSYIEYNQVMTSEFRKLQQIGTNLELDLVELKNCMQLTSESQTANIFEESQMQQEMFEKSWQHDEQVDDNNSDDFVEEYQIDNPGTCEEDSEKDSKDSLKPFWEEDQNDFINLENFLPKNPINSLYSDLFNSSQSESTFALQESSTKSLKIINKVICKVCYKYFHSSAHLKVHERVHTGEKPYNCSECSYRCSTAGNLKVHKRIHSGERPFVCKTCDKRFAQAGSYKLHKQIHVIERLIKN